MLFHSMPLFFFIFALVSSNTYASGTRALAVLKTMLIERSVHGNLQTFIAEANLESQRAELEAIASHDGNHWFCADKLKRHEVFEELRKARRALNTLNGLIAVHYKEPDSVKLLPEMVKVFLSTGYNMDDHYSTDQWQASVLEDIMNMSTFSYQIRKQILTMLLKSKVKNAEARKTIINKAIANIRLWKLDGLHSEFEKSKYHDHIASLEQALNKL